MTFDPNAQLDPGQITDRRGMGGRTGVAIGGGGLGLVLLLAYALLGGNPDDLSGILEPGAVTGPESSALAAECQTGQDANERDDCRILGYVNSVQAYWNDVFHGLEPAVPAGRHGPLHRRDAERLRHGHVRVRAVLLPDGQARLPRPRVLRGPADAVRGDAAGRSPRGMSWPTSTAITSRTCSATSARAPASRAPRAGRSGPSSRPTATRAPGRTTPRPASWRRVTEEQIADALDAAAAVGDDRIQESVSGRVDPEAWTHGSAEQRQHWFTVGYQGGEPADCDTFSGGI